VQARRLADHTFVLNVPIESPIQPIDNLQSIFNLQSQDLRFFR